MSRAKDVHPSGEQSFPAIVNVCVLRGQCPCFCQHCPVGLTPAGERAQRFGDRCMPLALFTSIASDVRDCPGSSLRIHGVGEPLCWEELVPALEYAAAMEVTTWLFTCLVVDDPALLRRLAELCSIVEVSVNSTDAGDYLETKGVDAFEIVKGNVQLLSEYRRRAGGGARLLASRVQSTDAEKDAAFVAYWKERVDEAFVRSYHTYNDMLAAVPEDHQAESGPCLVPFGRMNIDTDGEVVYCFNELFRGARAPSHSIVGDLRASTIRGVWQGSPELCELRAAHMSGDYSSTGFCSRVQCRSCCYRQPLRGNGPTSERQLRRLK